MPEKIRNILVIAESIDVEDSSGSKANVALIKNLKKAGFHLQVYHYTRKNIQLKEIPCFSIKENRRSLLFLLSRGERYLRYLFNLKMYKPIEKAFGFSFTHLNDRNSIIAALKKIKDFEPDLVITLSKGASFRPHHALLKLPKWHSKWIAYIHDPYPIASYPRPYDYVEPGHEQKKNFFLKLAKKAAYAAYPSQLLAEWMESYYPPLKSKRLLIPHQIFEPEEPEPEIPDFFKKNAFSIVHAGALMNARNPLGLLKAYKRFLLNNPKAKDHSQLVFLGKESKYTEEFGQLKRDIPQFYSSESYLPFSTVLAIQKNASANVILEAKGPISPFLPGKFPHCIQAKKPILLLGPYYSECRRLLGEEYPWWSEIDDEEHILKNLEGLYHHWLEDISSSIKYQSILNYLSSSHLKEVIQQID